MSAEGVAAIPLCEERRKPWLATDDGRWEAHWIDDGPEEKLILFCPDCAEREFGESGALGVKRPLREPQGLAQWRFLIRRRRCRR